MSRAPQRIYPKRRPGINNPRAAFWLGERCETIVAKRIEFQLKVQRLKKHKTAAKRAVSSKKQTCSVCGKHWKQCQGIERWSRFLERHPDVES